MTKDMDVLPSAVADFGIETEEQWQATRARDPCGGGVNAALVASDQRAARAQGLRLVEVRKEGEEPSSEEEATCAARTSATAR